MFVFGDSYSHQISWGPPSGNWTAKELAELNTNGPSWTQFMFQDEPTKLHSFSVKGATTDNSIVQGLTNYSLTEQIKLFQDYLVPAPAQLPWSSNNSLFITYIGLNDVGLSTLRQTPFAPLLSDIAQARTAAMQALYAAGARHCLTIAPPAVTTPPIAQLLANATVTRFAADSEAYSELLRQMTATLAESWPDADVRFVTSTEFYDELLAHPAAFGFTESNGSWTDCTVPSSDNALRCAVPMAKYVWYDFGHPTWRVQQAFAQYIREWYDSRMSTLAEVAQNKTAVPDRAKTRKRQHYMRRHAKIVAQ